MDVSDIKLLQSIYYILQASVSIRSALSLSEFRSFLLSELRKQGFLIELLDDQFHLYTANDQVILCFPANHMEEQSIMVSLMRVITPYSDSYLIAYGIQNKQGACVFRFELEDGFVSSHEKGN
jgi:hypothetical protein